jgi:predicted choloylglycine hydrolase
MELTRRRFLTTSGLSGIGLVAGLGAVGCRRRQVEPPPPDTVAGSPPLSLPEPVAPRSSGVPAVFSTIEATGSPEDIGVAVGRATAERIRLCFDGQREWFDQLVAYVQADPASRFDPFVAAIERHHPEVMAELRGMARGAGVAERDLVVWNLQPELSAMMAGGLSTGCSTIHLNAGDRLLLAHNEDGHASYREHMVVLRLHPEGKPAVTCLAYPGLVPGQVPAVNEAGLMVSTNYIATREVRHGVPRYVLGRAVLQAASIDQAVAVATNRDRAFAFTLHVGSTRERRFACLEVAPRTHDLLETRGIFVHTNHLVLPGTRDVPQDVGDSTSSRYAVLTDAVRGVEGSLGAVDEAALLRLLASHESRRPPYSPCRHPTSGTTGRTLATAVFDVRAGTFALHEGNPCEGRRREVEMG